MQTLTIEQDPELINQIARIFTALTEIKEELKSLKNEKFSSDEWLNAEMFCRKFGISRPTLKKRVESGLIEKKNFDGAISRYKWIKKT